MKILSKLVLDDHQIYQIDMKIIGIKPKLKRTINAGEQGVRISPKQQNKSKIK